MTIKSEIDAQGEALKIALTGAGGYLGGYLARRWIEDNQTVMAFYHRHIDSNVIRAGSASSAIRCNLNLETGLRKFRLAIDASERLDLCVLSHAVQPIYAEATDWNAEDVSIVFQTNLIASVNSINIILKKFKANNMGHLVYISSNTVTWGGGRGNLYYYLAKRAVEDYLLSLVTKYAYFNIRINIIRLGLLDGGASRKVAGYSEELYKERIMKVPTQTAVDKEDVYRAINYLDSSPLRLTGQILRLANGE